MIDNTTFLSKKTISSQFSILVSAILLCSFSGFSQLNSKGNQFIANHSNQRINILKGNNPVSKQSPANETPLSKLDRKTEDVAKRDLFAKHFKNNDGSYTAVISNGPMHYLKDGSYQNIEDVIVANGNAVQYPYANTTNLMESYFGATARKGIKSVAKEGTIKEFTGNKMYWEVSGQPGTITSGSDVAVNISGNKATYPGIFNNVDAEFTILNGARKLNYILKNQSAVANMPAGAEYLVFAENITVDSKWKFKTTSKGIHLIDAQGNIVYQYENPVSHDAKSAGRFENNTVMEVKAAGNILTVLTKVKTSWLGDSARVFPIMVDPTSVYYPQNAVDASGQCFPDGGGSGDIYAGYSGGWYRGWVTFNTTGLPACTVSSATVSLYPGIVTGISAANAIMIGQSNYDLSSVSFFPTYADVYNAITDSPTNTGGAYTQITSATAGSYMNFELGTFGRADVAAKAGGANSFFPISFSPSWGTGTEEHIMGFYGYADAARKPYLTVVYTQTEPYCHPTNSNANCAAYGDCEYIGISNVSLGTINNTTLYNNTPIGYNSYADLATTVIPENNYTLNVTYKDNGTPVNPGNISAWIDWNGDGNFSATEFLGNSSNLVNNQSFAFNFNAPSNVPAGSTRLRVRSGLTAEGLLTSGTACTSLEYGETEDYTINVIIPPVNDDCLDAINLTVGGTFTENAIMGTNEFASHSAVANPGCANYQGGDVWYTATVPASGEITIETGNAPGSLLTDTGIAVYSGNCSALTLIACDDNTAAGNFSQVALTGRIPGEILYIRTWGFANLISGTFQISAWDASLGTDNFAGSSVGLYPNPAHTDITIKSGLPINTIHIYSASGQLVQTETSKTTINIATLPNGVYMIQLELGTGTIITEKFIKN